MKVTIRLPRSSRDKLRAFGESRDQHVTRAILMYLANRHVAGPYTHSGELWWVHLELPAKAVKALQKHFFGLNSKNLQDRTEDIVTKSLQTYLSHFPPGLWGVM